MYFPEGQLQENAIDVDQYVPYQNPRQIQDQIQTNTRNILDKLKNTSSNRLKIIKYLRNTQHLLNTASRNTFNLKLQTSIDTIARCSYFYQPFDMTQAGQNFLYNSSICVNIMKANRRTAAPLVIIDDKIITWQKRKQTVYVKNATFKLKIQSQPHSYIFYTVKKNTHPLFQQPGHHRQERKQGKQMIIESLGCPCQLNIVCIADGRAPSRLFTLNIQSQTGQEGSYKYPQQGVVIRGYQDYNLDSDSGSPGSQNESESNFSFEDYVNDQS